MEFIERLIQEKYLMASEYRKAAKIAVNADYGNAAFGRI